MIHCYQIKIFIIFLGYLYIKGINIVIYKFKFKLWYNKGPSVRCHFFNLNFFVAIIVICKTDNVK